MNKDREHLKLLGLFHYIAGGLCALFACFPIIHLIIGIVMIVAPDKLDARGEAPPALVGWMFVGIALVIIFVGWVLAFLIIWAGRCLRQTRNYTYCFAIACVSCLFMPVGTVLGIFTLIALTRPEIKALFDPAAPPPKFAG